jgi:hypothetical protein
MNTRKPKPRRYRLTEKSGITLKAYRPEPKGKRHNKLPAVCKVYTREEILELEKKMGLK